MIRVHRFMPGFRSDDVGRLTLTHWSGDDRRLAGLIRSRYVKLRRDGLSRSTARYAVVGWAAAAHGVEVVG